MKIFKNKKTNRVDYSIMDPVARERTGCGYIAAPPPG